MWDIIGPVQDQQYCGAGYAFSTVGAAESAYAILTGGWFKLSEQQVIDCDWRNYGCDGGLQKLTSKYLSDQGSILAKDYRYTGEKGECKDEQLERWDVLQGRGYQDVISTKEDFINAVRVEPINMSFAVGNDFLYYADGVYTGRDCAQYLNHSMVAVGVGRTEDGRDYAIVKNSFGKEWGQKGYAHVELVYGKVGHCQMYVDNSFTQVGYDHNKFI